MTTSIVIPVFNGISFLKNNIKAVLSLGADEVVIVDDASTDGSPNYISSTFPRIKLVRHSINTGFPKAVNDGVAVTKTDIIFLLNQDVLPHKNIIKQTLSHFENQSIFSVTFNEQGRSWAQAQVINGFLEFKNGIIDDKIHSSFWASGGSAAFKKSMWDRLGGFDTKFSPGYFEDLDLSWRARNAGLEIVWDPQIIVEHVAPESTFNKKFNQKKLQRIKDRNYLLTHWKNLSSQDRVPHAVSLLSRIVHHPGFLIPTLMALWTKLA